MIRKVQVRNYKSLPEIELQLGRVTVLIGANGSGKSNILEAIALASAASQDKLENEFLTSRGIRVTEPRFMRTAFTREDVGVGKPAKGFKGDRSPQRERRKPDEVMIRVHSDDGSAFGCTLDTDETSSFPKWRPTFQFPGGVLKPLVDSLTAGDEAGITWERLQHAFRAKAGTLPRFLIFSPENSALRVFQAEGQILPLGIRGEGLFAHLKALATANGDKLSEIKRRLSLIDWFENFEIPQDLGPGERSIRIRDRYLPEGVMFDQRSANEGFLFLLFYLTVFLSPDTPPFFAIDNIDASLNPKLCTEMIRQLASLAAEHDRQVILTTHNPAILDGLDLNNVDHVLFVVDRTKDGHTRVRRIAPPKPAPGELSVSLSQAFMRGYIGGLPKNF